MSGRALRRLPVLALARYIGIGTSATSQALSAPTAATATKIKGASKSGSVSANGTGQPIKGPGVDVGAWLDAMVKVAKDQASEHGKLL
jgi:pachytene checkpoint protein 2